MMKESALKKRRRDLSVASSHKDEMTKPVSGSTSFPTPIDLWFYEEQEVDSRDPDKDLQLYKQTCEEISKLMKEILVLKTQKKTQAEINEKRIQASLQFINLKKLNRLEKLRSRKARDATNEAKQRVDNFQLQLQNLLYESLHLKKEVDKCLEFKSTDEEIELVPVEDFYREAPKSISKIEVTKNDPHQLMLARLDWELQQRKQLAEKCEEAQALKEQILEEIKTKQDYLDKLAPQLNSILQATRPLQNYLDMPLEARRIQHKIARYLPRPLFILYVQATAYHEACAVGLFSTRAYDVLKENASSHGLNKNITVVIEGDVDEARIVKDSIEERKDDDSGDSDQEESAGEKGHRRRSIDQMGSIRKQLLQKHPLTISVTIQFPDEYKLHLSFYYVMLMQIVTVNCIIQSSRTELDINDSDVLSVDQLLSCLFPNDYGNNTPNPMNHYQLQKLGMDDFSTYIDELGHPYLWAQHLAGLDFLPENPESSHKIPSPKPTVIAQASVSASHIEKTVTAIRQRFQARLSLHKQISSFVRGIVPVSSQCMKLFPTKISSRLTSWKSVRLEEHLNSDERMNLVESGIYCSGSMTFQAQLERGSAKLVAFVIISPDYPHTPPFFSLTVNWKYERTAETDDSLRDIEKEVNVHFDELKVSGSMDELLTNQMQRLLMCLDIYLETETSNDAVEGPVEFPKEKIFLKPYRGRDRSKPYKYVSEFKCFTHR